MTEYIYFSWIELLEDFGSESTVLSVLHSLFSSIVFKSDNCPVWEAIVFTNNKILTLDWKCVNLINHFLITSLRGSVATNSYWWSIFTIIWKEGIIIIILITGHSCYQETKTIFCSLFFAKVFSTRLSSAHRRWVW